MEKWRREEMVAHGDETAREIWVVKAKSKVATTWRGKCGSQSKRSSGDGINRVAHSSPKTIFLFKINFTTWRRTQLSPFRLQRRHLFFILFPDSWRRVYRSPKRRPLFCILFCFLFVLYFIIWRRVCQVALWSPIF